MKKEGFTLVEMLAVITIVALLAVIVLPLLSNQYASKKETISDVTKNMIINAAELYASETGKVYKNITLNDLVKDGKLEEPIKDYKTGKEIPLTKEISIDETGSACLVDEDDCNSITYKKYNNGEVVYFNPSLGTKCDKSKIVSITGAKTGCMKWYAFNDSRESNKVNLLLDHNTTANNSNNTSISLIKENLKNDTNGWVNVSDIRLIKANDIMKILFGIDTTKSIFDYSLSSGRYRVCFDTKNQNEPSPFLNPSPYSWLFENTTDCSNFGCNFSITDSNVNGYWTETINTGTTRIFVIQRRASIYDLDLTSYNDKVGIRPVISVYKYLIK